MKTITYRTTSRVTVCCLGTSANVLRPEDKQEQLSKAFQDADIILDMAASVPVARHLVHAITSTARRVSLFLNPRGTDLVCLAEGKGRGLTLDCLEVQYYRAVLRDSALDRHLEPNDSRLRYARSCRDVSFVMPSQGALMHGAIGAQAVRSVRKIDEPTAKVWRTDPETCVVTLVEIPLHPVFRATIGDWTLIVDEWMLSHLAELRSGRLPNETGGVLLGSYDFERKTVYVVETIHSPPDSVEWPELYIRGSEGLAEQVTAAALRSSNQLEYIGEWHSHPDSCSIDPSAEDMKVFSWMTDRMTAAGLPALMAIIGQHRSSSWFLDRIETDFSWNHHQQID
jgi:integrative and conjugative element protein (TIGR02256 family)